jgi:DNA-binding Lrp family transcriptional regulator
MIGSPAGTSGTSPERHHGRPERDGPAFEAFEASVAALDEVIEVRRMFGLPDYLLRVATATLESYEAFVSTQLGNVPGVDKLDSHLTMKLVKSPEHQIAPSNA